MADGLVLLGGLGGGPEAVLADNHAVPGLFHVQLPQQALVRLLLEPGDAVFPEIGAVCAEIGGAARGKEVQDAADHSIIGPHGGQGVLQTQRHIKGLGREGNFVGVHGHHAGVGHPLQVFPAHPHAVLRDVHAHNLGAAGGQLPDDAAIARGHLQHPLRSGQLPAHKVNLLPEVLLNPGERGVIHLKQLL